MKIFVEGKEKELFALGTNGGEWTQDLLGNCDALHYSEEAGGYVMTQKDFEWWDATIECSNQCEAAAQELGIKWYECEELSGVNDLEDIVRVQEEIVANRKSKA